MPNITPLDRQQLQDEVAQIQSLVEAACSVWPVSADNTDGSQVLEMALRRLRDLNLSLDLINAPKGEAA